MTASSKHRDYTRLGYRQSVFVSFFSLFLSSCNGKPTTFVFFFSDVLLFGGGGLFIPPFLRHSTIFPPLNPYACFWRRVWLWGFSFVLFFPSKCSHPCISSAAPLHRTTCFTRLEHQRVQSCLRSETLCTSSAPLSLLSQACHRLRFEKAPRCRPFHV